MSSTDNSAIYSAAISAGVDTMNMVNASNQSYKARNHSSEENFKARAWQEDMWNKTNAHNERVTDPAYVMKRLKDAGINPHLAYSNGSDFATPTAQQAQGGGYQSPNVPAFYAPNAQQYGNLALQIAQIKNINADTANKEANTKNTTTVGGMLAQDLENKSMVIDQENQLRQINIESGKLNLNLTTENVNKAKQEIINLASTNKEIQQRIDTMISQKGLNEAQTAQYIANLGVIRATIKEIKSRTNLNNEKSKTESSVRSNIHADTLNKGEQLKTMRRNNSIGDKYDLNEAENSFQISSADAKTAVQMFIKSEKDNKMSDLKITAQEYENDILLMETGEKAIDVAYKPFEKASDLIRGRNSDRRAEQVHSERNQTTTTRTVERDSRNRLRGTRTSTTRRHR